MPLDPARLIRVVLVVIAVVLMAAIILPFSSALIFAAILATTLQRFCNRLTSWFRGRRYIAAGTITLGVAFGGLLPLTLAGIVAVEETLQGWEFVRETVATGGIGALLDHLPGVLRKPVDTALDQMSRAGVDWISAENTDRAAKFLGRVVATTGEVALQAALMLLLLFFFLADGARLVDWLDEMTPLPPGEVRGIMIELRVVTRAVIISAFGAGLLQAAAATVGFLIASVPHPFFFALVTFLFSFVPAVGAGGVCLVLGGLLALTGSPGFGIFLAVWGIVVVGLVDNLARPWLMKEGVQLHGGVIFFALIGGIAAFGPVGLAAGPLAVVFFMAVTKRRQHVPSAV